MSSKLEEAARNHASVVYELYADSHSSDSEEQGFKAGAKWLLDEAQKRGVHNKHGEFLVSVQDLEELIGEE